MGIDYAFRFTARHPDESAVSDDDIVAAYAAHASTTASINDVPPALRDVIRRSLATAALASSADPLKALHGHFCDRWGRATWLCDYAIEQQVRARGVRPFFDLQPGPTDLWHDAHVMRRAANETAAVLRASPGLVADLDDAIAGLTCLDQLFARAEAENRDVQFLILP